MDKSMVGLFAGIGGLEFGLHEHGWSTELLCEIDPGAQAVLRKRFSGVAIADDVTKLRSLPGKEPRLWQPASHARTCPKRA